MSPKLFYLYKITNLINNKIYIGQTVNIKHRWSSHKNDKPKMIVSQAIKKYGINNFIIEIIAMCNNVSDSNETEALLIKQEESHISFGGYNVCWGGKNKSLTKEQRRHLSLINKGKNFSVNTQFKTKIKWPEDLILLDMVNNKGLTVIAKELGTTTSNVCQRLKKKKLHHNRMALSLDTSFESGSKHKLAKLTDSEVLEIVKLYNLGEKKIILAVKFKVSRQTIASIINGKKWSSLTKIKF